MGAGRIMKAFAAGVVMALVALGAYGYLRHASEAQTLELVDRCQQMGTRFADEIKKTDRDSGIPVENRAFMHRAHYNTVEQKCFVLTEGMMSVPFETGHIF